MSSGKKLLNTINKYGVYIWFVAIVIVCCLLSEKFYTFNNITNILATATPVGMAAIGITFVLIIGGMDLSGGTVMLTAGCTAVLLGNAGFGFIPTLIASTLAGGVIGIINGLLISRLNMVPFLTTFATQTLFKGLMMLITGEGFITHNDPVFMETIVSKRIAQIPVVVFIFLAMAVIGQLILSKTRFGWQLYAMGNNEVAAQKLGIKTKNIKLITYVIAGLLAGLSGFIYSGMVGAVAPTFGNGREFIMISAAVLGGISLMGGKGRILPGVIFGVLIFTIIENILVLVNANPNSYTIYRGIVIFLAVALDCMNNKGETR